VYVYKTAHTNDIEVTSKQFYSTQSYKLGRAGADPASKVMGGAISVIFASQVSYQVCYCKRNKAYFETLL